MPGYSPAPALPPNHIYHTQYPSGLVVPQYYATHPQTAENFVLQNTTAAVVNHNQAPGTTTATGSGRGGKRKAPARTRPQKRQRVEAPAEAPQAASICGVGPSASTTDNLNSSSAPPLPPEPHIPTVAPTEAYSSLKKRTNLSTGATDVWYFIRALDSDKKPEIMPTHEPILSEKPKASYIGCKLCTEQWTVWKLGDGMTTTVRTHLKSKHRELYEQVCRVEKLKHYSDDLTVPTVPLDRGSFSKARFHELLLKWIAVDDQSINVVECQEFRDLLLYVGGDEMSDKDIPHRTSLTRKIFEEYEKVYRKMVSDLQSALGRVSTTTDLWSDPNLDSFMGVTAHYMTRNPDGRLELKTALLAFRHVLGTHSGEHLAKIYYDLLKAAGILHKLGQATMDNAGNCNTHMEHFARLMHESGIEYDADGNRIRCFPHVINISTQHVIEELNDNPYFPVVESSTDPDRQAHLKTYAEALEAKPLKAARDLVGTCRASGQRRKELRQTIIDGNKAGHWGDSEDGQPAQIPILQLLRDCVTRWSSTFNMLGRVLKLYPAIHSFFHRSRNAELREQLLNDEVLEVAEDIYRVLEVPHAAQELLSSERTPTLSMSLPVYEVLMQTWKALCKSIPELAHYISIGLEKIEEYVYKSRKTRIYALAMIINPSMKFEWMKEHWTSSETDQARIWILEAMTKYRESLRKLEGAHKARNSNVARSASLPALEATRASFNQAAGMDRLRNLATKFRRTASSSNLSSNSGSTSPAVEPTTRELSSEELIAQEALERVNDRKEAERELRRYEEDGLLTHCARTTDLVSFWELNERVYPLLFSVAMDILPVQASAVPCERIFSSSKETCTLRRNRLSPGLLEALQILKFAYKQDRLDFTADLLAKEEDYSIEGEVTERAVRELIASGDIKELEQLFKNADELVRGTN